ncbi:non-canonical purine NTP pyrophosphatase [Candidatus Peregrinibacteria bacterium]|jgi:XTP/dITP diphosphohydrolase|nr:non-canonical purine NTP pyrophosphatase [Candidatus Peregrinibacteria bacterium]
MKILIATTNEGKFNEIMEVLSGIAHGAEAHGPEAEGIEFVSLKDLGITDKAIEDGETYLENAYKKAVFYGGLSGLPTVAEDSGLEVEALSDELGMHTRRWGAGEDASDEQWVEHFLNVMKKHSNKKASFKCTAYYIDSDGNEHDFFGECPGVITEGLEAPLRPGIPLSSCFKADSCDKVYSALSEDEKNNLSHRGQAMKKLLKHLQSSLEN